MRKVLLQMEKLKLMEIKWTQCGWHLNTNVSLSHISALSFLPQHWKQDTQKIAVKAMHSTLVTESTLTKGNWWVHSLVFGYTFSLEIAKKFENKS